MKLVPHTILILMIAWTVVITRAVVDKSWHKQIVKHGCAEFYLDANNDRQWRWKECQ